jgi:hypothetical protein
MTERIEADFPMVVSVINNRKFRTLKDLFCPSKI